VISDVDRIEWHERCVVLFPDSNYTTNRSVSSGWGLARELRRRGAIVNFAFTPADVGSGPDDAIFQLGPKWGTEQIQRAISSDGPETQPRPQAVADEAGTAFKDAAKAARHPPVRFRRTRGMLALPEPLRAGTIDELDEFLNVRREDKVRDEVTRLSERDIKPVARVLELGEKTRLFQGC
jgi:hypothetical protein